MAEREYRDYSVMDPEDITGEPDVLLDVPVLKVDEITLEVEDLQASVRLQAEVLDLVKLGVGADVHLGKVELSIKGVEAQALLKVRLAHVTAIIDRVLTTLDRNPEIVESLGKAVESAGHAVAELGEGGGKAVEDVGEGAGSAVQDVGEGAGSAVQDVGQGAGQALPAIGEGAGEAVSEVGQGAGQAAQQVGQGAGQAVGEVGQGAGQAAEQVGQGAGQAAQQVPQAAGQAVQGAGQAAQGAAQGAGQAAQGAGQAAGGAQQSVNGGKPDATDAAKKQAKKAGLDLSQVQGSGADGRITVNDIRSLTGS